VVDWSDCYGITDDFAIIAALIAAIFSSTRERYFKVDAERHASLTVTNECLADKPRQRMRAKPRAVQRRARGRWISRRRGQIAPLSRNRSTMILDTEYNNNGSCQWLQETRRNITGRVKMKQRAGKAALSEQA